MCCRRVSRSAVLLPNITGSLSSRPQAGDFKEHAEECEYTRLGQNDVDRKVNEDIQGEEDECFVGEFPRAAHAWRGIQAAVAPVVVLRREDE